MSARIVLTLAAITACSTSAQAGELFGGLYAHDVPTGITASGYERGVDFQLGYRFDPLDESGRWFVPAPHVFASVNSAGQTHYAVAGLSWKFGRQVYFRPGVGLAIHDGPGTIDQRDDRIEFGSRILFAPEIGIGAQVSERVSVEASWVHLSHAQLFSEQNPGIDNIGVRLNYRF